MQVPGFPTQQVGRLTQHKPPTSHASSQQLAQQEVQEVQEVQDKHPSVQPPVWPILGPSKQGLEVQDRFEHSRQLAEQAKQLAEQAKQENEFASHTTQAMVSTAQMAQAASPKTHKKLVAPPVAISSAAVKRAPPPP